MDKKDIFVTRSSMPTFEEYEEEIRGLWDSRWLTNMGSRHQRLIEALKQYLGVDHLDLVTNGHTALELTLASLHLEGEVITTPFTFISTTHAIVRNGLKPVFCDIRPDDFTMDPEKIESLITDRTCAIMPVHVYGNLCDTDAIQKIAERHHLKVIYDAAHAFGVTKNKVSAAAFGDVSCFSFHATKVFHTIEGGAVVYHDEAFGRTLAAMKDFGIRDEETIDEVGANAKMNEFCAAMGLCNLRHLDGEIAKRRKAVEEYRRQLGDIQGIRLNAIQKDTVSNYAYFPVIVEPDQFGADRDQVKEKLAEHGIHARKYFYPITTDCDCYKDQYHAEDTPIAYDLSRKVLTLPLYADLDMEDVDRICSIIRDMHH